MNIPEICNGYRVQMKYLVDGIKNSNLDEINRSNYAETIWRIIEEINKIEEEVPENEEIKSLWRECYDLHAKVNHMERLLDEANEIKETFE